MNHTYVPVCKKVYVEQTLTGKIVFGLGLCLQYQVLHQGSCVLFSFVIFPGCAIDWQSSYPIQHSRSQNVVSYRYGCSRRNFWHRVKGSRSLICFRGYKFLTIFWQICLVWSSHERTLWTRSPNSFVLDIQQGTGLSSSTTYSLGHVRFSGRSQYAGPP